MTTKLLFSFLFLFLLITKPGFAQGQSPALEWSRAAGGVAGGSERVTGSATDAQGNLFLIGTFSGNLDFGAGVVSGGSTESFVAKYSNTGALLWVRHIVASSIAGASVHDIAVNESGVFLTGYYYSNGLPVNFNNGGLVEVNKTATNGANLYVAKYDLNTGENQWVTSIASAGTSPVGIGYMDALGIAATASGVFITGYYSSTTDFDVDRASELVGKQDVAGIFLAKYDVTNGASVWVKAFEGSGRGYDVVLDGETVYMTGHFARSVDFNPGGSNGVVTTTLAGNGIFITSYAAGTGTHLWSKLIASSPISTSYHKMAIHGTKLYLAAEFSSNITFINGLNNVQKISARYNDVFITGLEAGTGNFIWAETITGYDLLKPNEYTKLQGLVANAEGVLLVGSLSGINTFGSGANAVRKASAGGSDIFVSHFGAAIGTINWVKTIGGAAQEQGQAVAIVGDDVYVAGIFKGAATLTASDAAVTHTSSNLDIFLARHTATLDRTLWVKHLEGGSGGSDNAYAMAKDDQGNVYLTGFFQGKARFGAVETQRSGEYADFADYERTAFIAKYSPQGEVLWVRPFGGKGNSQGYNITVEGEDVYVTGVFEGEVDFNGGGTPVIKTSSLQFFGDYYYGNAYVAKYNATSGENIWVKPFVGDDYGFGGGLAVYDGKVYVAGSYSGETEFNAGGTSMLMTAEGSSDGFVLKMNAADANVEWFRGIGGDGYNDAYGLGVNAHGVFITGIFDNTSDFNLGGATSVIKNSESGDYNLFVASYALADGENKWVQYAGTVVSDYYYGTAMAVDANNLYVTGRIGKGNVDLYTTNNDFLRLRGTDKSDGFLAKFDAVTGNALWAKTMAGNTGEESFSAGSGIEVDESGVYISGSFEKMADFNLSSYLKSGSESITSPVIIQSAGKEDAFLAKYTKQYGDLLWVKTLGDAESQNGYAVVSTPTGVYLTGSFIGDINLNDEGTPPSVHSAQGKFSDIFLAKYSPTISGVKDEGYSLSQVTAVPNPTSGNITIHLSSPSKAQNYQVTVFNILGEKLWEKKFQNTATGKIEISLESMPAGTYLLLLQNGNEVMKAKVVKL